MISKTFDLSMRSFAHSYGAAPLPAMPNTSLNLTRYGSRRLAAQGACDIMPCAAKRRLPPRAG